ncbi:MAG: tetratricopeptide repeat protein [Betaproteobacteria bacterium]|nr:tetratricopeptide repeat protein [Betaproteobacteria bacterium]
MLKWFTNVLSRRMATPRSTMSNGASPAILDGADHPVSPDVLKQEGDRLSDLGRLDEAVRAYRRAVAADPGHAGAWNNLGLVLFHGGDIDGAASSYERALEADPRLVAAWINLAAAQESRGEWELAARSLDAAIAIDPASREARNNAGVNALARGRPVEAFSHLRRGLDAHAGDERLLLNTARTLGAQGRIEDALDLYRVALESGAHSADLIHNYLLALNYAGHLSPEQVHDEHRRYARLAVPTPPESVPWPGTGRRPGRPLRVGFVSADLGFHVVSFFMEGVFRELDPLAVETFVYFAGGGEDAQTGRLRERVAAWQNITHEGTEDCVRRMRADALDVAVDLSGHMAGNRLDVFAWRVAPVQVTWLGYPNTTGMPEMDYRLTDEWADPSGRTDHLHTERLWRLPGGFLAYGPRAEAPPVSPSPCLANGHVTFGCFNNLAKVSQNTLMIWASVLDRVPGARLFVKARGLGEAETANGLRARFADLGGDPARLDIEGDLPGFADHLQAYGRVDIALDTTPYCGTTTTCEALWMGVPVVSLAGSAHVSRVGVSLLNQVGHPEWVAQSSDELADIVERLSRDATWLADVRNRLRAEMAASTLTNSVRFARVLTDALYGMHEEQVRSGRPTLMGKLCSSG